MNVLLPHVASNTNCGRLQAAFGAWSNVIYVALVNATLAVAQLLRCENQISRTNLLIFNVGSCLLVSWFALLSSSSKLANLLARLAPRRAHATEQRSLLANLWVPVTFQFLLAGWLVYATGGLTDSAFVAVPIAMMMIGYGVYPVPATELPVNLEARNLLVSAGRILRFYLYPQLLFGFLLLTLALLALCDPLGTHPAPAVERAIVPSLCLSIGMFVAPIAKRTVACQPLT